VQAPALTLFLMPAIIHMVFAGGSFLIRDRPRRLEQNLMGRVVSYAGGPPASTRRLCDPCDLCVETSVRSALSGVGSVRPPLLRVSVQTVAPSALLLSQGVSLTARDIPS